jgi:NAD(P)H dehydrogenase (quinone)
MRQDCLLYSLQRAKENKMILITGFSGKLSSLIHAKATSVGLSPLASSSTVQKETDILRRLDFDDPTTLNLQGVSTLLIVSAGYGEDDIVIQRHGNIISAAEKQGVKHIIYTSLSATGDHLAFALPHRWTEQRLMQSTVDWTILRNGLYAELIADLSTPVNGKITTPFGTTRLSVVARADLASAAVTVISNPAAHQNRIYELSGNDSWTMPQFAAAMNVEYQPVSLTEQRKRLAALSLLPFQPAMLMSIYSAATHGFLESHQSDLTILLKSAPTSSLAEAIKHLSQ